MNPKQEYIVNTVKTALVEVTSYLRDTDAPFALSDELLNGVRFIFNGVPRSGEILLEDVFVDEMYHPGRMAGRVYHGLHNPQFRVEAASPAKIHIGRVVEHCFALLRIVKDDSKANLVDMPEVYDAANDLSLSYSFLDEHVDPIEGKGSFTRRARQRRHEEFKEEIARQEDDALYRDQSLSYEEAPSEDFGVPELSDYASQELLGDDALTADAKKRENEAFNTAWTIIDGRDQLDLTWRTSIQEVLRMDVERAKAYLSRILSY